MTWRSATARGSAWSRTSSAEPAAVSYAVAGVRIFALGDVPPRADEAVLAPWSVGWFLDS